MKERDTPGGRLRSPLKLPSTSCQPLIRRGSELEKLFVFSDCRNKEASSSVSPVLRACPNWRTVAATSALIATVGSVVGDGVGSILGIVVGVTVGIAVGSGVVILVAVGSGVAVGLAVGATVGIAVGARVASGAGVASSPQAATETTRRARKPPSAICFTSPAMRVSTLFFN